MENETKIFNGEDQVAILSGSTLDFGHSKVNVIALEQLAGIADFRDMGKALQDYFLRTSQLMAAVINGEEVPPRDIAPDPEDMQMLYKMAKKIIKLNLVE